MNANRHQSHCYSPPVADLALADNTITVTCPKYAQFQISWIRVLIQQLPLRSAPGSYEVSFNGNTQANLALQLVRGETYTISLSGCASHPFCVILEAPSTSPYSGASPNCIDDGDITLTIPPTETQVRLQSVSNSVYRI